MRHDGRPPGRDSEGATGYTDFSDLAGRASWCSILDELERDVVRAEALAVGTRVLGAPLRAGPHLPHAGSGGGDDASGEDGPDDGDGEDALSDELLARLSVPLPDEAPWVPLLHHPPLPAEHAERARALLDRQIAIAAQIVREITLGRQHAAYAHHVGELEEARAVPAFIDEAV